MKNWLTSLNGAITLPVLHSLLSWNVRLWIGDTNIHSNTQRAAWTQ